MVTMIIFAYQKKRCRVLQRRSPWPSRQVEQLPMELPRRCARRSSPCAQEVVQHHLVVSWGGDRHRHERHLWLWCELHVESAACPIFPFVVMAVHVGPPPSAGACASASRRLLARAPCLRVLEHRSCDLWRERATLDDRPGTRDSSYPGRLLPS